MSLLVETSILPENMEITGHSDIQISKTLIDCIQQHNLSKLAKRPTRGENVIDPLFTSNPNMLSNEAHTPSLSYGHDAVFFDLSVKVARSYLYVYWLCF